MKHLKKWLHTTTLHTGGGRDDNGDILPGTSIPIKDCVITPRYTDDPNDRGSVVTGEAVLYVHKPVTVTITSDDRIEAPEDSPLPGLWAVDGQPIKWPFGLEVPLRKE